MTRRRRTPRPGRDYVLHAAEAANTGGEPFADAFVARVRRAIADGHDPAPGAVATAMARRPPRDPESSSYLIVCSAVERALVEGDVQGAIEAALFGASLVEDPEDGAPADTIDLAGYERSTAEADTPSELRR